MFSHSNSILFLNSYSHFLKAPCAKQKMKIYKIKRINKLSNFISQNVVTAAMPIVSNTGKIWMSSSKE